MGTVRYRLTITELSQQANRAVLAGSRTTSVVAVGLEFSDTLIARGEITRDDTYLSWLPFLNIKNNLKKLSP